MPSAVGLRTASQSRKPCLTRRSASISGQYTGSVGGQKGADGFLGIAALGVPLPADDQPRPPRRIQRLPYSLPPPGRRLGNCEQVVDVELQECGVPGAALGIGEAVVHGQSLRCQPPLRVPEGPCQRWSMNTLPVSAINSALQALVEAIDVVAGSAHLTGDQRQRLDACLQRARRAKTEVSAWVEENR